MALNGHGHESQSSPPPGPVRYGSLPSSPVHAGLAPPLTARRFLLAAEGEGALAVQRWLAAQDAAQILPRLTLLYTAAGSAHLPMIQALGADQLLLAPTVQSLLVRLDGVLASATMGTAIAAAGRGAFLGQVIQRALAVGVDPLSVTTELVGSQARRVQCVHCKGMMEGITTDHITCSHCGELLFVRDHYSHRLGAYMGVSAVAELPPGTTLPATELYS